MTRYSAFGMRSVVAVIVAMACAMGVGVAAAATKDIALEKGWNLVSSPLEPLDPQVDTMLASINQAYATAWAWDSSAATWRVRVSQESGAAIGNYAKSKGALLLTTLHAGQGFWLNMTEAATLTITGSAPATNLYSLVKGWNLIGTLGDQGKSVAEVVSDLAIVGVKPLSLWKWQGGNWAVALPYHGDGTINADNGASYAGSKGFALLSTLSATDGYWVNADAASIEVTPPPDAPMVDQFSASSANGYLAINFTLTHGDVPITGLSTSLLRLYVAELVPGAAATDSDEWQRWAYERTGTGYAFGNLVDQGQGHYQYTFATPFSSAPNPAHQQRMVLRVSAFNGLAAVNKQYDFNISDPAVELPPGKDIVTSAACNSCHGANINNHGHGGGYTGTKTCVICHSPLLADPDMAALGFDFVTMIHQIHAAINGKLTAADSANAKDWSAVTYPGVKSATAKIVVDCAKCHQSASGDNWTIKPTMVACRSCHTTIVFDGVTTFTGLDGVAKKHFQMVNNDYCHMCHGGDNTFAPLATSHALPASADATKRPMSATISGVTVDPASGQVTVSFTMDQHGTPVTDKAAFKSMAFTLAKLVPGEGGASSHWESYTARSRTKDAAMPPVIQGYSESVVPDNLNYNAAASVWEYTFALPNAEPQGDINHVTHVHNASSTTLSPDIYTPAKHPTDSNVVVYDPTLTHRVGMEFVEADGAGNKTNATFDFVPNGSPVTKTRNIVTMVSCNTCHGGVKLHKGYAIEYCVTCHNQSTFDPYSGAAPVTVDLQHIVHKLHMAGQLPSVVAGGKYLINGEDFSEVKFPQPLTNCKVCHNESNTDGANWKNNPTRRACGTCHDSPWDLAHFEEHAEDPTPADAYSGDESESCTLCHGPGKIKPVAEVHSGV